ncbi:AGAP007789-PA-like protein [Anopheles sinensis]|uniref:AGAP007789-PA-like protein n=1 Tax=Anopheles sinensis TaxID=74873 RepID=A0A084VI44_ANOSI|nr:AGAP007789-PA-like protein [Anopheles sinensis]
MDGSALSTFSRGSRMSPKQRNGSGTMATTDPGATTDGPAEKGVFPLANGANGRERRSAGEGPPPGEAGGPRDTPPATNRIRSFMGKTPSAIKSKFLSVLGNSTEIINGISNKIDAALSLTSSSDTETTANRNQMKVDDMLRRKYESSNMKHPDDTRGEHQIDYELRRAKERRAHEEVLSGRYRNPPFSHLLPQSTPPQPVPSATTALATTAGSTTVDQRSSERGPSHSISADFSHSNYSNNSYSLDSKSPQASAGGAPEGEPLARAVTNTVATPEGIHPLAKDFHLARMEPRLGIPSSASTSDNESCAFSGTLESSELKMWIRSESENSVPSWASSISLDSQSEEAVLDFMKRFVRILFHDSTSITLQLKSDFGQYARTETGRLWFSRLVNAQRAKTKRVDESTFYSLIQYFAIVLFECAESEDYSPAKTLMNMCFTFYHDIDVPGCDPYREYLYTYLRDQPIWQTLRFWNAAFFDALQTERKHRPVPPTVKHSPSAAKPPSKGCHGLPEAGAGGDEGHLNAALTLTVPEMERSSSTSACDRTDPAELQEDKHYHQNLSFGQLGSFTCNMHAFGLSRELCNEFLVKQGVIANLSPEQQKLLQENVDRMYRETDPWREN